MAAQDGNGWVDCRCGSRHWGLHGAAGLVLLRGTAVAGLEVLLQLRARWTHEGGSWGVPGGARDSHEDVIAAALREAAEEAGVDAAAVRVLSAEQGVDHGDWRYTYVIALAQQIPAIGAGNAETDELRWVKVSEVPRLPLHPALGAAWPRLSAGLARAVVDSP